MENSTPISNQLHDIEHYDFELPSELIAQEPLSNREDSRLLVVDRQAESLDHQHVRDLDALLHPGDCLVLNDTRVIPAQLVGKRIQTGGRWQGLVLDSDPNHHWKLLAKTRGKVQPGEFIMLHDRQGRPRCRLLLVAKADDGSWIGRPLTQGNETEDERLRDKSLDEILQYVGRVPLPHYIRGGNMVDADVQNYQTVYAQTAGAIAAPTAGLHFTTSLLQRIQKRGVSIAHVTLHVGIGTFRPVSTDDLTQHKCIVNGAR